MRRGALFLVALLLSACCSGNVEGRHDEPSFIAQAMAATVLIETPSARGSGTVVYSDRHSILVLTCAHVVADEVEGIEVSSPSLGKVAARVEKFDAERDLALLHASVTGRWDVMKLAHAVPRLYSRVYVAGSPLGDWGQVSEAFVTEYTQLPGSEAAGKQHVYRITGSFVAPGISGGTAFNHDGELVCVPSNGRVYGGEMLTQYGYCVDLATIRDFLRGYRL